ncbi:hypothetical protein LZ30DRAFT_817696 [Colletotrichum cereale]|nr:hypothetical protein LZ30DRAFT_817696 [Colletotrichum cereale]
MIRSKYLPFTLLGSLVKRLATGRCDHLTDLLLYSIEDLLPTYYVCTCQASSEGLPGSPLSGAIDTSDTDTSPSLSFLTPLVIRLSVLLPSIITSSELNPPSTPRDTRSPTHMQSFTPTSTSTPIKSSAACVSSILSAAYASFTREPVIQIQLQLQLQPEV